MSGSQSQVWVAGHDGRTLIRADAITAICQENGQVTARLAASEGLEVLLAAAWTITFPQRVFQPTA